MARYRATLAYDGTAFHGFQLQNDLPTVQGAVENALAKLAKTERVPIHGAGRTDTGVHATGQVIAFDLDWSHPPEALQKALNANLPPSVAVYDLTVTRDDFHPRFDAQRRAYVYTIVRSSHPLPLLRHRAWILGWTLNLDHMVQAAETLIGRRDFAALGTPPQGDNTVRTIYAAHWQQGANGDETALAFYIEADAFLYRMVRRTVGMLVDVGRGHLTVSDFADIIKRAQLAKNVTIAPPQGLILSRVVYADDKIAR